ncbi:hypothetical protein BDM02DRAFT_3192603 [Thelephora ganbajun]|uniref:Uncharacterized protein n=1 Tax=Thelephora ganbajun TaxID=370292 RepID=A0ACB6Z134_THEGA|nr:hypothetical protein BDM02DRAFT_3192603 [Thelephora ganbajun]
MSSDMETQVLQSHYDELWDIHLNSCCEITADLYAKMLRRHDSLLRLYQQSLKSHATLRDDLRRLAQQVANPFSPCAAPFHIYLVDNEMPFVGSQIIFDAFHHRQ